MPRVMYALSDHVFDNIVGLVSDTLDKLDEENFESRRDYLGYMAELNEILDELIGLVR